MERKKPQTPICLKWIKIVGKKTTEQSQNILHGDTLYNIERKKYKTVSAELASAKVTFNRMVLISYRIYNFYLLCSWIIAYSTSAWSKVGTLTVYFFIKCILMPPNCIRSGKCCKMYAIFTVFKFRCTFSTFSN